MASMRLALICLLGLLSARTSHAQYTVTYEPSESAWHKGNRIVLTESSSAGASTSTFSIGTNRDMSVVTQTLVNGKQVDMHLMFIGGCWLALKDFPASKGQEIDVLDGEVITLRTLFTLLQKAAPGGPRSITQITTLKVSNKADIPIYTYDAQGGIPGPWKLTGTLSPGEAGVINFDLRIVGGSGEERVDAQMKGSWQKVDPPPADSDETSLEGWQVYTLGPIERVEGNNHYHEWGANGLETRARTIGDLRQLR